MDETALIAAAHYGGTAEVELLLAVPGIDFGRELTALTTAAHFGHTAVVKLLKRKRLRRLWRGIIRTTMGLQRSQLRAALRAYVPDGPGFTEVQFTTQVGAGGSKGRRLQ